MRPIQYWLPIARKLSFLREVIFGKVGIAPLGFVHHLGQICGVCKNGTPTRRHQDDPRHAM